MRILHYFLGFHRQGGLNRYAADLAVAQAKSGDEVFVLYPAGSIFPQKKAKIHCKGSIHGIPCFALTGGRCLPIFDGIRDPEMIFNQNKVLPQNALTEFWNHVRPEVLHIHTWMGFPEEILPVAKANNTKVIYTTHDYFGLCPIVNRLREDGTVCSIASDQACSFCNRHAPSERYLELRNNETLIRLKSLLLPLKRILHRSEESPVSIETMESSASVKPYEKLRKHYFDLFRMCDKLHFNSPVTQAVFSKILPDVPGEILPITHSGITDRRSDVSEIHQPLHFAFFGSSEPYKGLPMLLKVLQSLNHNNLKQWHLDIYGCNGEGSDKIEYHGFYHGAEEWRILNEIDLLVVPSIWDETFGFVVEEALCTGVPVLCSDKVGAGILVDSNWIFSGEDGLLQKLKTILENPELLLQKKNDLLKEKRFFTMSEHVNSMKTLYLS